MSALITLVPAGRAASQAPPAGPLAFIEMRVVNEAGDPVVDLEPADVTLKVSGRVREVRSLDLVQFGMGRGDDPVVDPPFETSAQGGRHVFVLLDTESFSIDYEPSVRDAAGRLLSSLSPDDRVAVMASNGTINVGPTTRHASVRAALVRPFGQLNRVESATETACRSALDLQMLDGLFAGLPGSVSTTVFFLSAGLSPPVRATTANLQRNTTPGVACEVTLDDYNKVLASAGRAGANFHVAQLMGAVTSGKDTGNDLLAGIESLAGVSGNRLIRLTGNNPASLAQAAFGAAAYYRVGFAPDPADRSGAPLRVDVGVGRPGTKARAPSQVTIPKGDGRGGGKAAVSPRDMLSRPQAFSEFLVRALAMTARGNSDREMKVVTVFEPVDPSTRLSAAAIGLFDQKGRLKAQWTAQAGELSGPITMAALQVPAGTYRLRVAATDREGQRATVDCDVPAELTRADPVRLSDLALGAGSGGTFGPRLLFRGDSTVVAYFEIYGMPKAAALSATFELAASNDGPAMLTTAGAISPPGADGTSQVLGRLSLDAVAEGDYVVRATVKVGDRVVGRLVRTLRKAGQ